MKAATILTAAAVLLAGCYSERYTENFEQYPDLVDSTSAIVDESGLSEGQQEERRRILQALEDEPPAEYRINAGDKVYVTVYNHNDISINTTVTPDGSIGLVFLGQVKVAGLTLAEAAKKIETGLAKYVKKPSVGISPYDITSETATIGGAVANPGMYGISTGMRLADLYAKSGGSSVREFDQQQLDAADLGNSVLVRGGEALPIDFRKAIEGGDRLHNVKLKKGDYVYVAVRSESMVCLVGDVKNPHKRLWDKNLGLLEVLTTGGWMNETYWPYAIIIRGGVANPRLYKVDVDAILSGRKPNVMLESGDVVFVPHDSISEYNVFVRKLLPTAQLASMFTSPLSFWLRE